MRPWLWLSGALMIGNVGLIGWIGLLALRGQLSGEPEALPPLLSLPRAAEAGDPKDHLPLAGMPGATGSPADACVRLEGFFINLNEALLAQGRPAPLQLAELQALSRTGPCGVDDPPVRAALDRYAEALRAAGQPLYPPLSSPPAAHRSLKVRPR
jgi:hypothetical protein